MRGLSFYDALIIQAAAVSGCQRVLSDAIQHGATMGSVRIENPFAGLWASGLGGACRAQWMPGD